MYSKDKFLYNDLPQVIFIVSNTTSNLHLHNRKIQIQSDVDIFDYSRTRFISNMTSAIKYFASSVYYYQYFQLSQNLYYLNKITTNVRKRTKFFLSLINLYITSINQYRDGYEIIFTNNEKAQYLAHDEENESGSIYGFVTISDSNIQIIDKFCDFFKMSYKDLIHYLFINLKNNNCNLNYDSEQQSNVLSLFSKYQSDDYYFINHFNNIYNEIKSKIEQEMIELKQHKKKYIEKQIEKIALSIEEKLNRKFGDISVYDLYHYSFSQNNGLLYEMKYKPEQEQMQSDFCLRLYVKSVDK